MVKYILTESELQEMISNVIEEELIKEGFLGRMAKNALGTAYAIANPAATLGRTLNATKNVIKGDDNGNKESLGNAMREILGWQKRGKRMSGRERRAARRAARRNKEK